MDNTIKPLTDKQIEKYKHLFEINTFTKIFKKNIDEFIYKNEAEDKEITEKIKDYIKNATNGNLKDRANFKEFLKTRFLTEINIYDIEGENSKDIPIFKLCIENEKDIVNYIIPFKDYSLISARDKFEIILYKYKEINELGYDRAFDIFRKKHGYINHSVLDTDIKLRNEWYEYKDYEVDYIYTKECISLSFEDKVNIIIQRLYEEIYGLSALDILAYSDVNEVGISDNGKSVYCWADDKIKLSFLQFTEEQTRIIQERSISFDDKAGQLCTTNPEILCYRADNARITAVQPPYFSARNLSIRIFNKRNNKFKEIIKFGKQQLLIQTLIKTGLKISLQGPLGSGKTTGMQVMLEVLDDSLHIGTVEDYFEQHNMIKYPNKRIVESQVIENKSLMDCVMSLFRMSVDVASLGEAREGNAVFSFIQLAQAIENTAMLTSHIASPEDTVPRYKNMLIATGKYFSEQPAIADIVNYINIIFQFSIIDNERRISQIVEIIPLVDKFSKIDLNIDQDEKVLQKLALIQQIQQNTAYMYRLNTIMAFENGEYRFKNFPSERTINKAYENTVSGELMDELLSAIEYDLNIKCELART